MATFKEVILTALKNDQMKLLSMNQHMIEVASATKKKSAFVKSAVTEELATGLMQRTRVAFILHMDAEELNRISAEIDS